MKNLPWIIVGIGITTGLLFLFNDILSTDFFIGLLLVFLSAGTATGIGFFTLNALPRTINYRMHTAILLPWLSIFATLFLSILLYPGLLAFFLIMPVPFVFSSIGGVAAYRTKIKKEF